MFNRGAGRIFLFLVVLTSLTATPRAAERVRGRTDRSAEERMRSLEERLLLLERKLDRLVDRIAELGGARDVSREADEALEIASEANRISQAGLGPEASPAEQDVASIDSGPERSPYGGYMELHLNHDNLNPTTLDFHRFVLLFGHRFDDRISFVGELELEHALVEGGEESGELELEQAYLDFLLLPDRNLSFRAGMMLTPVGFINETHEPASFNGVERPFVDEFIVPTTWFAPGAGLVGDLGAGFSFKAFAQSSLNGAFFSAEEGWREGRQKGFFDNASHAAGVGRLEYSGLPDLNLGVSFWAGNTGFDFDLSAQARLFEFDGQYSINRFDFRGQFAYTVLDDADEINRAVQRRTGVSPNIAEAMRGYYLEGAAHVLPQNDRHDLVAFYRFEEFDTQFRMPDGFLPLEQFDRTAHVIGVTYLPHPDIAFKFDYNILRNDSSVVQALNRWNFGIGWWF